MDCLLQDPALNTSAAGYMELAWNERARQPAFVDADAGNRDGEEAWLFAQGEQRARMVIDPVLEAYDIAARQCLALDHGCGHGCLTRALARRFDEVVGIDVSPGLIAQARHLNRTIGNAGFVAADGASVPAVNGCVHFLFSDQAFRHMPSLVAIQANLRDLARVLVADGYGLIRFAVLRDSAAPVPVPPEISAAPRPKSQMRTSHPDWRCVEPLGKDEIARLCRGAGFDVLEFRDDPTDPGDRGPLAVLRRGPDPA
ncbi:class I SAM-dependent methyltransferase [Rhodovastum atsumiense]|nr:class I SAM-dependent methyltransferase [Rhodovastum atsumiense]